ncbi:flagellar basal body rod protein FlgC [Alkaliphilus oremlandii]|uniref:Flagellar basal-body rod protein FlgC n=1 Tax=Alkaliphilus oremlandii (strain OhILAs) TaxID=350688 RepID=A8MHD4_ALKOO|nr:flagellar basal body rod protein FlgC [Alkaliphilus oremlandii]ABW19021.1 flagellar basal-body rod protein FlgC [Alkaliphilus oremlandii OhILAs]
MSIFNSLNISASGLTAERLRMDIATKNIANANTTRTSNGTPYRRQVVVFKTKDAPTPFSEHLKRSGGSPSKMNGVEVSSIQNDTAPYKSVYEPGHPDADENGYVKMPNVDIMTEMANMISASRAYEANITAMNGTKSMFLKTLEIGK